MAQAAFSKIESHERECAIRWAGTMKSMGEIKAILAWGTAGLISALGTVIFMLINHPH